MSEIEGRYLYSIINNGAGLSFGDIGINDNRVYTIPYKDIAAVVHSCQFDSSKSHTQDNEKAKEWILVHNYVIERAAKQSGTVLPFAFYCRIRGNDDTIKNWLDRNYSKLKRELERVKDKAEYSVQIFCDQDRLEGGLVRSDKELRELKEKMEKMSKGAAYLFARRFELKVKDAVSAKVSMLGGDFISMIRDHVEDMKVEEKPLHVPEKYMDKKLVVALSCLVHQEKVEKLGEVLDEINRGDGFAVRFTGPWAPFSFVELKED